MKRIRKSREKQTKRKILIVDDQMENIRPFKLAFRKEFEVLTAMSGFEAIEVLASESVELIISDHNMPGMTGLEFLTIVDGKYPDIPKLMLTGNTDIEYLKNGIRDIHVEKIVMKPYDRESLLSLFWKLLSNSVSHAA